MRSLTNLADHFLRVCQFLMAPERRRWRSSLASLALLSASAAASIHPSQALGRE
jgi:hypothetical protein